MKRTAYLADLKVKQTLEQGIVLFCLLFQTSIAQGFYSMFELLTFDSEVPFPSAWLLATCQAACAE